MKSLTHLFILGLFIYSFASFIAWSGDPSEWPIILRAVIGVFFFMATISKLTSTEEG